MKNIWNFDTFYYKLETKFEKIDEIIKKDENSNLTIPNQKYEYQKSKFAQKSDNFHNSHIKSFKN